MNNTTSQMNLDINFIEISDILSIKQQDVRGCGRWLSAQPVNLAKDPADLTSDNRQLYS
jgi:hypothetical protein